MKTVSTHRKILKNIYNFKKSPVNSDYGLIDTYYHIAKDIGYKCAYRDTLELEPDNAVKMVNAIIRNHGLVSFYNPDIKPKLHIAINKWNTLSSYVQKFLEECAISYSKNIDGDYVINFAEEVCRVIEGTKTFKFHNFDNKPFTQDELFSNGFSKNDIIKIKDCYKKVNNSKTFVDVIKNIGNAAKIEYDIHGCWDYVCDSLNQNQHKIDSGSCVDILSLTEWVERALNSKEISIKALVKEAE
jgi:hypothetical protein